MNKETLIKTVRTTLAAGGLLALQACGTTPNASPSTTSRPDSSVAGSAAAKPSASEKPAPSSTPDFKATAEAQQKVIASLQAQASKPASAATPSPRASLVVNSSGGIEGTVTPNESNTPVSNATVSPDGSFIIANGIRGKVFNTQGALGAIYARVRADVTPEQLATLGIPAEGNLPSIGFISGQDFEGRPRLTGPELSQPQNFGRWSVFKPAESCFNENPGHKPYCGQSWLDSPAVLAASNMVLEGTGEPGRINVKRPDMARPGWIIMAHLITGKDPVLNKNYLNDGRYRSTASGDTAVLPGADVQIEFKGGKPGTAMIVPIDPVSKKFIRDADGGIADIVASEGSDYGVAIPLPSETNAAQGQQIIEFAYLNDLKHDPNDASEIVDTSIGPTAPNKKQNILDLRFLGTKKAV